MSFEYSYRTVELNNGYKVLIMDFAEKKYDEPLFNFLHADVSSELGVRVARDAFDRVLSGEVDYEETNGNASYTEITPTKTKVFHKFAIEGMVESCEVDTKELRELIDIWYNKLTEFNEKYNKKYK